MAAELAFIGPLPPPQNGASIVTSRVLQGLRTLSESRSVEILVVPFERQNDLSATRILLRRAANMWRAFTALMPPCRVAYISVPSGYSAWGLLPAITFARLRRVKLYLHHHSFSYLNAPSRTFGTLFRAAGTNANHWVLCNRMQDLLRQKYLIRKTTVLNNLAFVMPNVGPNPSSDSVDDTPITLGHLSNLTREKGLDTVLDIARELTVSGFPFRLLLAGPADGQGVEQLINESVAALPAVEWVGALSNNEVASFLSEVDLFVFPSRYRNEAQPMVVLEAAASGVPTLATPVGCLQTEPWVKIAATEHEFISAIVGHSVTPESRLELAGEVADLIKRWTTTLDRLLAEMLDGVEASSQESTKGGA